MSSDITTTTSDSLAVLLRALKLPTVARLSEEIASKAEKEGWTYGKYLHHLAMLEVHDRRQRRIERLQRESDLLPGKTLATLDRTKLPEYVELSVVVSAWSTVRVKHCAYSVPARLIGARVRVRLFEQQLEVWFADQLQLSCERLLGRNLHRVDYRHVI